MYWGVWNGASLPSRSSAPCVAASSSRSLGPVSAASSALALASASLGALLGGLGGTLALAIFAGLLLLLSFVLLGIRVFRLLAELLGQTQMGQQLAHAQRERLLVGQMRAQIAPVLAGPALQPGAPVIELRPLLPRQVKPEQALLRVQLQRRREIGLLVARGAGRAAMARGVRAGEIGGDAQHALGAERLDPDLLESAEDRLRHLAVRRQTMVQLGVMVTQPKRCAIRLAAQPRHVLGRPSPAAAAATASPAARSPAGRSPAAPPAGPGRGPRRRGS